VFSLSLYMRRPTYTQSTASGALIPTSLYMVHFRVLPDYLNRAVIIPLRVRKKKSKIKCVLDLIYVISIVALVFWFFFFDFPPFINLVWNTTPPVSDQSFDRKIFPTRPPPPPPPPPYTSTITPRRRQTGGGTGRTIARTNSHVTSESSNTLFRCLISTWDMEISAIKSRTFQFNKVVMRSQAKKKQFSSSTMLWLSIRDC
jgi:hypothetical protein